MLGLIPLSHNLLKKCTNVTTHNISF